MLLLRRANVLLSAANRPVVETAEAVGDDGSLDVADFVANETMRLMGAKRA